MLYNFHQIILLLVEFSPDPLAQILALKILLAIKTHFKGKSSSPSSHMNASWAFFSI